MGGINHELKVVLIHNPRCGGTAMQLALGMDHVHDTMYEARKRHGELAWDGYFKFSFVRNPMDRLISTYQFARMEKSWYHDNLNPGPEGAHGDAHPDYVAVKDRTFEDCLRMLLDDPGSLKHPGWKPQTHFVKDPEELDSLGRLETAASDWEKICAAIGLELPLAKLNESAPLSNEERAAFFTPFTCAAAERLYLPDFVRFGYRLPLPFLPEPEGSDVPAPITIGSVIHGAVGIAKAITGIGAAGQATIDQCRAICQECEYWGQTKLGIGCRICGCSALKLNNASETCPLPQPKWGAVPVGG